MRTPLSSEIYAVSCAGNDNDESAIVFPSRGGGGGGGGGGSKG